MKYQMVKEKEFRLCNLLKPFKLLLLDEITTDLDIVTRRNFQII